MIGRQGLVIMTQDMITDTDSTAAEAYSQTTFGRCWERATWLGTGREIDQSHQFQLLQGS